MNPNVSIKFLGGTAADNHDLTGSASLLTISSKKETRRIMIDAGLIQCKIKEKKRRNLEILGEFTPSKVDLILLTHAHVDHVGRVPLLTKNGFKGKVGGSKVTLNSLPTIWKDSAKIQKEESSSVDKSRRNEIKKDYNFSKESLSLGNYDKARKKKKTLEKEYGRIKVDGSPLYNIDDVEDSILLINKEWYINKKWTNLFHGVSIKTYSSGHVLGGIMYVLRIKGDKKYLYLGFTGDLGREKGVILPPPEEIEEKLDYLTIESTYGGILHPERNDELKTLINLIKDSVKNKKRIIIPSFVFERTQEIVYLLSYFIQEGIIDKIPIYIDSPMAIEFTKLFAESWNEGMFLDQKKLKFNPFDINENKNLNTIEGFKESINFVNSKAGPYIVIAGSGMCDAGRVRDHLRTHLKSPKTVVCLVGFMTEGTLGRKLKNKWNVVKMNKEEIHIKAQIIDFDSFSAHADHNEIVNFTKKVVDKHKIKDKLRPFIFINHGEEAGSNALRKAFIEEFQNIPEIYNRTMAPKKNREFVYSWD